MRQSKQIRTKIKVIVSINKELLEKVDNFVRVCDNRSINRSVIIEDVLADFIKNKKKQDELFPEE